MRVGRESDNGLSTRTERGGAEEDASAEQQNDTRDIQRGRDL